MKDMAKLISMGLLTVSIAACSGAARQSSIDDTLRVYERSIRWGEYGDAQRLQKEIKKPLGRDDLREIKVVSYTVIGQRMSDDSKRLDQTVEIRFYHEQQGTIKTVTDQQTWIYNTDAKVWQLDDELPDFLSAIQ